MIECDEFIVLPRGQNERALCIENYVAQVSKSSDKTVNRCLLFKIKSENVGM